MYKRRINLPAGIRRFFGPSLSQGAIMLLLLFLYTLAGKLGLKLAFVQANATAIWPPAGIALAALILVGYRVWPAIFLGAFLVNITTAGSITTSFGIATGNTLEGLLGAYLVNRFANGRSAFEQPYGVFKFAYLAGLFSTAVSATFGVTTLALGGFAPWADYKAIWFTWWLGDIGGDLLVAPLLILWSQRSAIPWNGKKILEAALLALLLVFVVGGVFGGLGLPNINHQSLEFLCIPFVIWAAFRFSQREAATGTFLIAVIAVLGTLRGFGPFGSDPQGEALPLLQAFLGVVAVMGLALAAAVAERREAQAALQKATEEALRQSENRFRRLIESNVIGILVTDSEGGVVEANAAFVKMLGFTVEDLQANPLNVLMLTPPEYRVQDTWVLEQLRTHGECSPFEKEFLRGDGSRIPVLIGGVRPNPAEDRSVFFVVDVTHRRQALQALRKAYDEIELRVEQRTAELEKEVIRRRRAESKLRELSLHDPLTRLYNRRGFRGLAEQQVFLAIRDKKPFLFFFADVDGLKPINDTLGHDRGDQAIIEAANVLRGAFRQSDIIARMGGDEFAVLALETQAADAEMYKARLQAQLHEVNKTQHFPFTLSLSVGVAFFDPFQPIDIQELIKLADKDLYLHKAHPSLALRNPR